MADIRQLDNRTGMAMVALVTTPGPAGADGVAGWALGWDPRLATFAAGYLRGGHVERTIGVTRAAYPSPGALEEALGFALPSQVTDALRREQADHPALAAPRGLDGVGEIADAPRGVETFPVWESTAAIGLDQATVGWGLALERDRRAQPAVIDLGGGTTLEVVGSRVDPAVGAAQVSYRLSHARRVIFAGDDVSAPAGADVSSDDSVRALLAVLVDVDPAHRPRLLSPAQRAFLAAHGDRLLDAAAGPPAPYPRATRVAVAVDGQRHLGQVQYPVLARDGAALAYAWAPDVASLVGHPWRRPPHLDGSEPDRSLITPATQVTATLARPEIGAPGPGEALVFGAIVAAAHPDTGQRVEATVLRAFAGDDGVVYQVEPHTLDDTEPFMVPAERTALVRGTWWPSAEDMMAARRTAGLGVVAGEILPGGDNRGRLFPVAGDPDLHSAATPELSAAQQESALLVGLDPVPHPTMVTVDIHGQLARVGDPGHGWLVVPAEGFYAAMAKPAGELAAIIAHGAPGVRLNGSESLPTLAALAVRHTPERLNDPVEPAAAPLRHLRAVPASAEAGL